ncbi:MULTISPECIES: hypothetical protein [Psychrilyobacter]|uniref:Lipoprotein n=1 Tax=Psychrilyobacter piezotolerans TaxID=2293438 RepID=A0ABX9KDB3_9FUSO|nr:MULTISPECIES: hypothetical protein [Psychrilyobacter]MCS5423193.1 hypothetical protein [Psychrilyobacter sp. S5]NDI78204.1 hypothetical protein [Psychrilyobacter piezotolerans]RDE58967.1 hypothetical protein DV867_14550 [Psychrilyobacter sp. S5]REI39526.1 hypothetical protein DYH56_14550 [Psychrilyobacter piezotolerans]
MKKLFSCLIVLMFIMACTTHVAVKRTTDIQSFKVGGVEILIPSPTIGMKEVGYEHRERMEAFMPLVANRLVAMFMTHEDLLRLEKGNLFTVSEDAQVMVLRRGEFINVSESDFKAITDVINDPLFENKLESLIDEIEEDFNRQMKLLDLDEFTLKIGQPIHLGQFFSKKNAYGDGTLMTSTVNGDVSQIIQGAALVRVNNKIIYIYFSDEYKNINTIKKVRTILEKWADDILKVNEEN